ncbi:MAG: hypothetical protein HOO86_17520 [Bacteroidales bacterium]|nr:hypothetical protein [Bacteroidales bacterium]
MRILTIAVISLFLLASCEQGGSKVSYKVDPNDHEVRVKEVLQASAYTYLLVKENGDEYWIAVSRMDNAAEGNVFHYNKSMEMKNFTSKDLSRTFDKVLFIDNLSSAPIPAASETAVVTQQPHQNIKPVLEKKEVKVEQREGTISIAELYNNSAKYENQMVKVVGEVTKFNTGIMKKNWAHIQDGTVSGSNFDLTVTTLEVVNLGDVVIFEGKISLKKDFGAGYYYEVILEDAKATNASMH